MTEFVFAPATKAQAKARVAIDGPSGSGKTWSALSIAQGLGRRIAVIDTERGSASKYAGDFRFDTLQMHTYDPRDLVKALSAAAGAGYDVVIVDSLSHFWMGKGGMLEQVDGFTKRSGGSSFSSGWKDARPIEREMIDGLLAYPGHVIVTMRTKSEWVITENDRGKKEPKKIGLKAEQRDGLEYEFDIVGDLDLDHNLVISKSRMSALADKVITRPTADMGAEILAWLSDGNALPGVEDYIQRVTQTDDVAVVRATYSEVQQRGMGAAPCMRGGQSTTLLKFITDRGVELAGQQPTPQDAADAVVRNAQQERVQRSRPSGPVDDEFTLPDSVRPAPSQQPQDVGSQILQAHHDARYRQLLDDIKAADVAALDALVSQATEARDAEQLSPEQWATLSAAADTRAGELVQAMAGEESQEQRGFSHRALAETTGARL